LPGDFLYNTSMLNPTMERVLHRQPSLPPRCQTLSRCSKATAAAASPVIGPMRVLLSEGQPHDETFGARVKCSAGNIRGL